MWVVFQELCGGKLRQTLLSIVVTYVCMAGVQQGEASVQARGWLSIHRKHSDSKLHYLKEDATPHVVCLLQAGACTDSACSLLLKETMPE